MLSRTPQTSYFSRPDANCVMVWLDPNGYVCVSHSRTPTPDPHRFTFAEWDAFIRGVKAGQFDLPEDQPMAEED